MFIITDSEPIKPPALFRNANACEEAVLITGETFGPSARAARRAPAAGAVLERPPNQTVLWSLEWRPCGETLWLGREEQRHSEIQDRCVCFFVSHIKKRECIEHRREHKKLQGKAILNTNRTGKLSQNNFEYMYQVKKNRTWLDWDKKKHEEKRASTESVLEGCEGAVMCSGECFAREMLWVR